MNWPDGDIIIACHPWAEPEIAVLNTPLGPFVVGASHLNPLALKKECELCHATIAAFPVSVECAKHKGTHLICRICYAALSKDMIQERGAIRNNKFPGIGEKPMNHIPEPYGCVSGKFIFDDGVWQELQLAHPKISWLKPIFVRPLIGKPDETPGLGCRICIARYGLAGFNIGKLPKTQAEFDQHLAIYHPTRNKSPNELS
jgi:hypothetical protein